MLEMALLRPAWLLALIPLALAVAAARRRDDARHAWSGVVATHLLEHLLVDPDRGRRRTGPLPIAALALGLGIVALSGPSFGRMPSPFAEEEAVVVVVMSARPTMAAKDVQPSRLERAAQKVRDLLTLRPDVRAGLVTYAGSAHPVVPPTRDVEVVRAFAGELRTDLLPAREGDAAADAIAIARGWIERAGGVGTVLWVTDSVDVSGGELAAAIGTPRLPVALFGVGAGGTSNAPFDAQVLEAAAGALGASMTLVSPDETDVERLASLLDHSLRAVAGETAQRRDDGYWFLVPILLLALLWARKGWLLTWT
jgi:Ca-activated chloride channel family protein